MAALLSSSPVPIDAAPEHFAGFVKLFSTNECLLTLGKDAADEAMENNGRLYIESVLKTELASYTACQVSFSATPGSKLWVVVENESHLVTGSLGVKMSADGSTAELVRMYVDRTHRRKGYGRLLVNHLLAHVESLKVDCTKVFLTTPSVNLPAIGFYENMGFTLGRKFIVNGPDKNPLELAELELELLPLPVDQVPDEAAKVAAAVSKVPRLRGFFSGCTSVLGVYIRAELDFNDDDPLGSPVHLWVWSSATECFDISNVNVSVNEDRTLKFGPRLMEGMEGRVVTDCKAKWDADEDNLFVTITIKVGFLVPAFDITTTCIGVDSMVGGVSGKGVKRIRPY
jgi:ribosomal protein S18 acetylase RimI-like enzyme